MPSNGYSAGRDVTLTIVSSDGPVNFDQITGFRSSPEQTTQKVKGIDGITRTMRFPDGWNGSFTIERRSAVVDKYFAKIESDFHMGKDEKPATITQTILEPDGSLTQFRYTGVLLKYDNAGEWAGDKSVPQTVSFMAERRLLLA